MRKFLVKYRVDGLPAILREQVNAMNYAAARAIFHLAHLEDEVIEITEVVPDDERFAFTPFVPVSPMPSKRVRWRRK